jgi:hypothetical protein
MTRADRMRASSLVLVLLLAPASFAEAQQPLPDLSLEELMSVDAGRVFGASGRLQPVTEAPASVSFITAEEIQRYGYRTLADILRGVGGMYVTDDRNFSYLGIRGFGNPGDYNSRVLLLVNGHRVNDNVYGQAEIGADFGIDRAVSTCSTCSTPILSRTRLWTRSSRTAGRCASASPGNPGRSRVQRWKACEIFTKTWRSSFASWVRAVSAGSVSSRSSP